MNRRQFTKTTILGTAALAVEASLRAQTDKSIGKHKSHYLTLSFDDGFKKSFYRIADIHEKSGLHACLNVLASGHFGEFSDDTLGNFDDWNKLKARGHEIMPHGWEHAHLTGIPPEQAKELITKCLDSFEKNLDGFVTSKAVFNFPYNASNPELEDFVLQRVRAVRTGGWTYNNDTALNPMPSPGPVRIFCQSHGPDNSDAWTEQIINDFLASEKGGWLVLNLHGVDGEGWGPVSSDYLSGLLGRLVKVDKLAVMPAGEVLVKG